MTVFQNVSFPLRFRSKKVRQSSIEEKVYNTLKLVGLADLAHRPATNLSGGQQQRVALARALVAEPQLVLFDEPLSNLDAKLREYMRVELVALQKRLGFTAIYVTHDQQEALAISDQMIIMNEGSIEQQGMPFEIYKNPRTSFAADFMGSSNAMKGRVVGRREPNYAIVEMEENGIQLTCSVQNEKISGTKGMTVMVSFRPERTRIIPRSGHESFTHKEESNRMPGEVEAALFLGEFFEYSVKVGNVRLKARSRSVNPFPSRTLVYVTVAPEDCLAIAIEEPSNP
jgi:iron(III) transport system ATP-binding protein